MYKFITYVTKYQFGIQGSLLWVLAFANLSTDKFWSFSIPAIILIGIQDILTEIRNNKKSEPPHNDNDN
jgi:hypothetical protein